MLLKRKIFREKYKISKFFISFCEIRKYLEINNFFCNTVLNLTLRYLKSLNQSSLQTVQKKFQKMLGNIQHLLT